MGSEMEGEGVGEGERIALFVCVFLWWDAPLSHG